MQQATNLGVQKPNSLENCLVNVLLNPLQGLTVEMCSLACELCQETDFLAVRYLLFQEHLLPLSQHQRDERLDRVAAKIRRWSMKEVFVYIGEHSGGCLEGMVGRL